MSTRGKRLFACRDCGQDRYVHWGELNRRAGPRCFACGGFLDPKSTGAKEDRLVGDLNLREYQEGRGDVALCSELRRRRD